MHTLRGFTLREVVAVLAIIAVLSAVLLVMLDRARYESRVQRDMDQVRGIHQGLVFSVPSSNDEYLLPSRIDRWNTTVAEEGAAKNTTTNIMSILIANGSVSPEMLVSPLEVNPAIRPYRGYRYELLERTEQGYVHFWDPAFSADFTAPGGGHVSYAHLPPVGPRRARWASTFVATEAVLGMRGPQTAGATYPSRDTAAPTLVDEQSLTLRFFRTRGQWAGHVVFNDNHVEFLTVPWAYTYVDATGRKKPDLLHYDEPDDPTGLNDYLGIFIRAGETPRQFKAIWD